MAIPNSRASLISYCKRKLGHGVIDINISTDQEDDAVDEALQYYQDYHVDAIQRTFLKHQLTSTDITNEYITISDAITGYFKILFSGRNGEAYNIGVENPEISMLELAEKVIKIGSDHFDYKGKLIFGQSSEKEYLTDNPQRRCPVIEKAKKELNYKPKVDISTGLLKSMYWYSENLK